MKKLITVKLTELIGKTVTGLTAQVRNPIYLDEAAYVYPIWRKIIGVKTSKERGEKWVELQWEKQSDDNCGFTGCTINSNHCQIQFEPKEYAKIKN